MNMNTVLTLDMEVLTITGPIWVWVVAIVGTIIITKYIRIKGFFKKVLTFTRK